MICTKTRSTNKVDRTPLLSFLFRSSARVMQGFPASVYGAPFVLLICSVFQPLQLLVCPKLGYPILWLRSLSGNAFPPCVGLPHKSHQAIFDHTDLIFHLPGSADFNRNAARQRTVPTATAWHGELANSLGPAKPPSITSLWAHRAAPDPTLWRDRWLPGPRRAPSLTKQN